MKKTFLSLAFTLLISTVFSQVDSTFTAKNMKNINTIESNFGVSYYTEGKIIFTSPKRLKIVNNTSIDEGHQFLDLMIASIDESGNIHDARKLKYGNSRYNEALPIFTKDYKKVFFTKNNIRKKGLKGVELLKDKKGFARLGLCSADIVDGKWKNILKLPLNNANYSVGHPALSPDNKTLYYVSDMLNGKGKTDIYCVDILGNNKYGTPKNLGNFINSESNEMFPYVDENNILYFSSDRKGGLGKLDVYSINLNSKESKPKLLASPINSKYDDFAFVKRKNHNEGYFSSNRKGGMGSDDIYHYWYLMRESSCLSTITITVVDATTKNRIKNYTVVLTDEYGKKLKGDNIKKTAYQYRFSVPCSKKIHFSINKEGYVSKNSTYNMSANENINISMVPIIQKPKVIIEKNFVEQPTVDNKIENIYFDYSKHYLTLDSRKRINKIIAILLRNKNLKLEIGVHTDSRGAKNANMILSQKRAKAIVNYMVRVGNIDISRLKAIGYGETKLLNECRDGVKCSELNHQINRRAEFKLIE